MQFRFGEELVAIEDTDEVEAEDKLKRVVTSKGGYLCRKVIVACGLLHFPRRLAVLDAINSKNVHYKIPKIGDYEGHRVAVVGGGDSALDAALMVLGRHGAGRRHRSRGRADRQGRHAREDSRRRRRDSNGCRGEGLPRSRAS